MLKTLFLLLFGALCILGNLLHAQNLSGKWYGVGYVQLEGSTDSYLAELIIKQDGKQVKAEFNYYFKDKLFKNKIEGVFDKTSRVFTIKKVPVIFYRTNDTKRSVESIMSGSFELRVSKVTSVLNGLLISAPENQYMVPNIQYRFLRSMGEPIDTTIEEPDPLLAYQERPKAILNIQNTDFTNQKKQTDLAANKTALATNTITTTAGTKSTQPNQLSQQQLTQPIQSDKLNIQNSTPNNQSISLNSKPVVQNQAPSSLTSTTNAAIAATVFSDSSNTAKSVSIPLIETRKKSYFKELDLDNSKIQIEVYDNGEIDYDSVSLYLNGKMVLAKTMLNHRSVRVTIQLDPNLDYNELGMFAENLGMIPPNTAAMIVHDGKKEYQVLLQSDFSKSAILKLKVRKSTP